jgi:hypothetical protein
VPNTNRRTGIRIENEWWVQNAGIRILTFSMLSTCKIFFIPRWASDRERWSVLLDTVASRSRSPILSPRQNLHYTRCKEFYNYWQQTRHDIMRMRYSDWLKVGIYISLKNGQLYQKSIVKGIWRTHSYKFISTVYYYQCYALKQCYVVSKWNISQKTSSTNIFGISMNNTAYNAT